jgi:hypothetical protein
MSATSAPFGFRPAFHPSGLDRATRYPVNPGYGTAMYKNQPCILNTAGYVTVGTSGADLLGVIAGFEYIDTTGKPNVSSYWPASQTVLSGTTPVAYVYDDPNIVYEVQSDGSIAQTALGDQADVSNVGNATSTPSGNNTSTCTLSATLAGAGSQGQFRIVGVGLAQDNAWGDAYTVVQVKIARHQYVANKVAI